jgi:Acetyltransferase (GNAT) domain
MSEVTNLIACASKGETLSESFQIEEGDRYQALKEGLHCLDDIFTATDEMLNLHSQLKSGEFFPSAAWLSCYAKVWPENTRAYLFKYRLKASQQLVYAVASTSLRKSRFGRKIRSLGLNEAPLDAPQDLQVEQNGFVGIDRFQIAEPLESFISQFMEIKSDWDEIRLNSMDASFEALIKKIACKHDLICYQTHSAKTYHVDYAELKDRHQDDYLKSRSTNTRAQIRQSMRRIENSFGPLEVNCASSIHQAQEWFTELVEFHRQRWNRNGECNNFEDERFKHFLSSNIDELLPHKRLALLRISAGKKTLAIYYYYLYQDKVYFYIGGIDYSIDATLRPGIVGHFLAVNFFSKTGKILYDFLPGDGRYKGSLSTSIGLNQGWLLQRKTKSLLLENKLRQFKRLYAGKNFDSERTSRNFSDV